MATQKTIGMISLGCPKNQVDAELMLDKLARAGFAISGDIEGCDAVIVNTCGFIEARRHPEAHRDRLSVRALPV